MHRAVFKQQLRSRKLQTNLIHEKIKAHDEKITKSVKQKQNQKNVGRIENKKIKSN